MTNKAKAIFIFIITALVVACIIHTTIAYVNIGNDPFTSFPASGALLLIVPYAVAVLVCIIVWLVIKKTKK